MDAEMLARLHSDIGGQLEQAQQRAAQAQLPQVVPKIGGP
jgi:hypothetical protein